LSFAFWLRSSSVAASQPVEKIKVVAFSVSHKKSS